DDRETLSHGAIAAEQHRGRRCDTVVERRDRSLLELDVERPEVLAIGHDQLLERLLVMPAEPSRPLERETARLRLYVRASLDRLHEIRGERRHLVEEAIEQRAAFCGIRFLLRERGGGDESESGQRARGME